MRSRRSASNRLVSGGACEGMRSPVLLRFLAIRSLVTFRDGSHKPAVRTKKERAGLQTEGRPGGSCRVYFVTWDSDGSRASRFRVVTAGGGTTAGGVGPGRHRRRPTGTDAPACNSRP